MRNFIISLVAFNLAVLLKPYTAVLLLPFVYLLVVHQGWVALRRWPAWTYVVFLVLPFLAYREYQVRVLANISPEDVAYSIRTFVERANILNPSNLYEKVSILLSANFIKRFYNVVTQFVFNPLGFGLLFLGLMQPPTGRSPSLYRVWMLSFAPFFIVMPELLRFHGYYWIYLLGPGSYFVGRGCAYFANPAVRGGTYLRSRTVLVILGFVFLALTMRHTLPIYRVPPNGRSLTEAAASVRRRTPPDALLVVSGVFTAALIYYAERRGWQNLSYSTPAMERFIRKGATHYVTISPERHRSHVEFARYMDERHEIVVERPGYLLYRLHAVRPSAASNGSQALPMHTAPGLDH